MDFRRSYYGPWRELGDDEFAFDESGIKNAVKLSLKREPTRKDFELVGTMVRLFSTLPASHGRTSVVKTLRGDAKVNRKLPEYGAFGGLKEYTGKGMDALAEYVECSMRASGLRKEQGEDRWNSDQPEWVERVERSPDEGIMLAAAIARMGAKYAGTELTPKAKKEKLPSASKFYDSTFYTDYRQNEAGNRIIADLVKLAGEQPLYGATRFRNPDNAVMDDLCVQSSYYTNGGTKADGDDLLYTYYNKKIYRIEGQKDEIAGPDPKTLDCLRTTVRAGRDGTVKGWSFDFVPLRKFRKDEYDMESFSRQTLLRITEKTSRVMAQCKIAR